MKQETITVTLDYSLGSKKRSQVGLGGSESCIFCILLLLITLKMMPLQN